MRRAALVLLLAAAPALPQAAVLEPVCVPVAGACQVHVGEPLAFLTFALGAISYRYDWGDGPPEVSAAPILSHAWGSPGLYVPKLTVQLPATTIATESTLPVRVAAGQDIPTLSTAGLTLLALLLAAAAFWLPRRRHS